MSTIFQSARLTYREARPGDIDDIHALYNDPEVQVGVMGDPIVPRQAGFRETIENWTKTNALYAVVVDSASGEFVGTTTLWQGEMPREYMLGIQVRRAFWGKGFGKEIVAWTVQHAFRMMGIHRITLGVFESNPRAQAVYKAVGFVQEGVKRKARFVYGKWEDVITMGILEDEYFARATGASV